MRIGITGSIACGKSTVAGYLRSLGYRVVDADAVSRELTKENGRALPKLREVFPDCFTEDGKLNRKALGTKVFHDPEAKKQLEHILHPMIFEEIDRQMAEASEDALVFADIPLLFECGMEAQFDEVWTVVLDPVLQMKRLMERDHMTEEEAQARIDSQMPQSEKAARANRCISTDGTPEETRAEVDRILASLRPSVQRRRRRREPAVAENEADFPEAVLRADELQTSESEATSSGAVLSSDLTDNKAASSRPINSSDASENETGSPEAVLKTDELQTSESEAASSRPINSSDAAENENGSPRAVRRRDRLRTSESEEVPHETIRSTTDVSTRVRTRNRSILRKTPSSLSVSTGEQRERHAESGKRTASDNRMIRLGLFVILCLTLLIGGFFSVRAFVRYREEQKRIEAEAREREQHPLRYGNLIMQYSARQQLDPSLVSAVILCESSFNPDAVSRLGARGLMQLMEDTAGWIAHKLGEDTAEYSFDRLFDPEINIRFGTWYLGYLSRRYDGDAKKMVCAYHAGQGNVDAWLKKKEYSEDGVTLTTIPTQDTSQYAGRVLKARAVYEKYYFAPQNESLSDGVQPAVKQ